jgi:phosphopantothenoylcysteine synthetase/decarboxylase
MSDTGEPAKKVLFIIVCGAPAAAHVGDLVELTLQTGWDVYVIPTPQGAYFIESERLKQLTGHAITSSYREPGAPKAYPEPDAIIVAPATFNTINKWAQGIADTPAVGLLCEHMARQIPIVVYPMLKNQLAQHPAYKQSLKVLKTAGIRFHRRQSGEPANGDYRWVEVLQAELFSV